MQSFLKQLRKQKRGGFTLIELIVVVAIIAILTAIITANFASSKAKARDSRRVADIGTIQIALGLFFDRCGQYPTTLSGDPTSILCPSNSSVNMGLYISKIPTPPVPPSTITAYEYGVNNSTTPTDYVLKATLEGPDATVTVNALTGSIYGLTCDSSPSSLSYCVGPK